MRESSRDIHITICRRTSASLTYDTRHPKPVSVTTWREWREGWGGTGGVQDGGDACIPVADSCCYMTKTIGIL